MNALCQWLVINMNDIKCRLNNAIDRMEDIESLLGMQYESIIRDTLYDAKVEIDELKNEIQSYKDRLSE